MQWQQAAVIIHETVVKHWPVYSEEDQRFLTLALAGEVGEFANIVKKLWRGDFEQTKVQGNLAEELADIRISLELLAAAFDVDLDEACESKMSEWYNRWPEGRRAVLAEQEALSGDMD